VSTVPRFEGDSDYSFFTNMPLSLDYRLRIGETDIFYCSSTTLSINLSKEDFFFSVFRLVCFVGDEDLFLSSFNGLGLYGLRGLLGL